MPRALPEFGQHINAFLSRLAALAAIYIDDVLTVSV